MRKIIMFGDLHPLQKNFKRKAKRQLKLINKAVEQGAEIISGGDVIQTRNKSNQNTLSEVNGMKCPYCNEFKGNSKVRCYPVKDQLWRHIEVDHKDKLSTSTLHVYVATYNPSK